MEDEQMANKQWCSHCQGDVKIKIQQKKATYEFKGESFEIIEKIAICEICEGELPNETLDSLIMEQLTDMYMKRKGITFEEIREVRNQCGLSMQLFSSVLNWSKATIARYESGRSIPDSSHMAILKMLKNHPEQIEDFYKLNKHQFTEKEQQKIEEKLKQADVSLIEKSLFDILKINYHMHENTIESGYSRCSLDKLIQMIIFFSENGIQKTKLMKLLFYSDFLNYKRNLLSISGIPYLKYPHGPVPKDYELLLSTLQKAEYIDIDEQYSEDYTYILINPLKEFEADLFDEDELKVLKDVKDFFEDYGSVSISEFSHKEDGWIYTENRNIVPYDFADTLQLN
jgi:putative zinc finger/helix-turn-helix YgiT family protein